MSTRPKRGNRQAELFARSTKPVIAIEMNHRLVRLTHELDWTELEEVVEEIRARKLKNAAGRPPRLRALIGAVVFRATRRITYRETEDQIRHYVPARYLCGLTETDARQSRQEGGVRSAVGDRAARWRIPGGEVGIQSSRARGCRYAVTAVDDHIALFGKAPKGYAYDRAGYSEENVTLLMAKGVKHVGLPPRGRAQWAVSGSMKQKLIRERAQVEGGIGTVKHSKYGFTKPAARSAPAMAMCGQSAILGYNLNKFVRGLAERNKMVLVG